MVQEACTAGTSADLNVRLKIEQIDIEEGCPADSGECAAALALARWSRLEGPGEPEHVEMADFVLLYAGNRRWKTDMEACGGLWDWIDSFDRGGAVKPAEFEFTLRESPNAGEDQGAMSTQ